MAKQTFTTGQVLTASAMTSLQQTAMLGGAASAKTASYTLVAADAGTAVSMSSASATTITVNTALFAAGDTVHITNLGAGVCTITAGTATVNSSASLALAQYESGFLDFTSTSAAIFVKGAGAAAASGGMTLLETLTLSGASVTSSTIPGTYKNLAIVGVNYKPATDGEELQMRINGDSGANRYHYSTNTSTINTAFAQTSMRIAVGNDDTTATGLIYAEIYHYANTTTWKTCMSQGLSNGATNAAQLNYQIYWSAYNQTGAITSLTFFPGNGNFTSGSILIYGVS